ncbi:MAG: GguC protein, partial [Vicinamibacterales bacterium]
MTRVVQVHDSGSRRVGLVDEPHVRLLAGVTSVFHLAQEAAAAGTPLAELVGEKVSGEVVAYDAVYLGQSPWRLLPAIDHPDEPARCLVSGTGLTH